MSGPLSGMLDPYQMDDEEERKRRLKANDLFGPGLNAPAAVAGGGPLAASGLPGGLWGPPADYSGQAGSPRSAQPPAYIPPTSGAGGIFNLSPPGRSNPPIIPPNSSQAAQIDTETRGDNGLSAFTGPMQPPMVGPSQQWNPTVTTPSGTVRHNFTKDTGNWTEGKVDFWPGSYATMSGTPLSLPPGSGPDSNAARLAMTAQGMSNPVRPLANAADPMDRLKQVMLDKQANVGSMGYPEAERLAAAQITGLGDTQQQNTLRDVARIQEEGKVKAAEQAHRFANSPETGAMKAAMSAIGTAAAQPGADPTKIQAAGLTAYRDWLEAMRSLEQQSPYPSAVPGPLGQAMTPPAVGAQTPLGTAPDGKSARTVADQWKKRELAAKGLSNDSLGHEWMVANANFLPTSISISGAGKNMPMVQGQKPDAEFKQLDAENLIDRMETLDPEVRKSLISEIGRKSPAFRKAMISAAAVGGSMFVDWNKFMSARPAEHWYGQPTAPDTLTLPEQGGGYFRKPLQSGLSGITGQMGRAVSQGGNPLGEWVGATGEAVPVDLGITSTNFLSGSGPYNRRQEAARRQLQIYNDILRQYGQMK